MRYDNACGRKGSVPSDQTEPLLLRERKTGLLFNMCLIRSTRRVTPRGFFRDRNSTRRLKRRVIDRSPNFLAMMMRGSANFRASFLSAYRARLRAVHHRAAYFPGVLGLFINPFYFARKGLAKHIGALAGHITGRTLDVGCGNKPYLRLYRSEECVGLEIDTPQDRASKSAEYYYDGSRFPFADESFDSIVAGGGFRACVSIADPIRERGYARTLNRAEKCC